jgi:hypothetical protein
MSTSTLDNIQPAAVMSPEELERWNGLPPDQQLARLRAAIARGVESGTSDLSMDQIRARLRTRHTDAKL